MGLGAGAANWPRGRIPLVPQVWGQVGRDARGGGGGGKVSDTGLMALSDRLPGTLADLTLNLASTKVERPTP